MPGRRAARHMSKLDIANRTRPATSSAFKKKSIGDAKARWAKRVHGAEASSEKSPQPDLRSAIHNSARAATNNAAIAIVITAAVLAKRVSRRQSSSGPVHNSSSTAASASSAA
jgi:hypothetical protein